MSASRAELENLDSERIKGLLHELQVYQVELEMQNEELREAQAELESSRDRYFDLYDQAPVGYATIGPEGLILEANLAMEKILGRPRSDLTRMSLRRFVTKESQDTFYLHQKQLPNPGDSAACDVEMLRDDGSRFWAHLDSTVNQAADGAWICRSVLSDISERKRAEAATQASESFSKNLIHFMLDGLSVVDENGVALIANPAFCQMTGFSEEELIGVGPPHPYWPPEELPGISAALKQALGNPASNFELMFMRKNGERFPAIISVCEIRNTSQGSIHFAATVKDITLRKQAETALREWNQTLERRVGLRTTELQRSEGRFQQLVEATFEGVAISENGIIVDGNPQFAAMYHCDINEMIGRPIAEFVAPESKSLVASQIRSGVEKPYEFLGIRKDGTRFSIEAHGRMMTWQGKVSRVTALRDLTSEKQVRAELDHAISLALMSEISAGIIHQIGQPLSAIGANTAAAATRLKSSGTSTCDCLDVFEKIDADLMRMRDTMSHLRALTNIEEPNFMPIDFNAMVVDALHAVRATAEMKSIRIEMELEPGQPQVKADAVQLRQVVMNLAQNSIDACAGLPHDRLRIRVVTRLLPTGELELSMRDFGTGISDWVTERMFSPFFSTKGDGIGIGLRLCQIIVHSHHGSITGSNHPDGIGATFQMTLPLGSQ